MSTVKYLFTCLLVTSVATKECYWNSRNAYNYFSTKTSYGDVRGDIRDETTLEGCSPISVWAVIRHGTRKPLTTNLSKMKQAMSLREAIIRNHYEGRGEMCSQDISDLANWTWDDNIDRTTGYLTKEGYQEVMYLGQRIRERFTPLLNQLDAFQFRSTDFQRTRKSAEAFLKGLNNSSFTVEEPLIEDDVIYPYANCSKFQQNYEKHPRLNQELKKFQETKDYQQMLSNTRQLLGLPNLTPHNVTGLYTLCSYLRAFTTTKRHVWCSVFHNEDLPLMEYTKDLEMYFKCGYGSPTASRLGELPLKNLHENLEASVNGSRRFTAYFAHDTILQMIFTTLGLYKDFPEINGSEMNRKRKWRTSFFVPFAANFIVVLNQCPGNNNTTHKVQMFINEVLVPFCGNRTCDWLEFGKKIRKYLESKLDFCNSDPPSLR